MPPPLPSSNASRLLPTLVRAFSSTSSAGSSAPTPSKQHHVKSYPASAFPFGFSVASTHSGIKKTGALDLGVLVSERPCAAAASVTRNVFKAAPVTVTTEVLEKGKGRVQGFVVNSGCANAVTGKKGLEDAWAMSRAVGEGVLVMSTGVIGQHLPIDGITGAIPKLKSTLASTPEAWLGLAKAFMTTDTFPKLRTKTITLGGKEVRLAGIDKGAGMIAPNMGPPHATLLGVVATDAAIAPEALQSALNYAVDRSFNSITVDGDVSTNDTILCLANGAVEGKELTTSDPEFEVFREELRSFAEELAQLVVRDGEGATKFVTVRVKNAPTFDVANAVARSVANSTLVKTAFYGQDANWGRILCAVGYTAVPPGTISPDKVSVSLLPAPSASDSSPLLLLANGEPEPNMSEERASAILSEEDFEVEIDLGGGKEEARVWTCDLSHEYVTINGSYRS